MRLEGLPDKKKPVDFSRCFNSVTDGMKLLNTEGAAVTAELHQWKPPNGCTEGCGGLEDAGAQCWAAFLKGRLSTQQTKNTEVVK